MLDSSAITHRISEQGNEGNDYSAIALHVEVEPERERERENGQLVI